MAHALFSIWYLAVFSILTILAGLFCIAASYVSKSFVRRITSQGWALIVLRPAGIKVETFGRERLPDPLSGGFIIFANHRSLLDIPTVAEATGRSISWVAKEALGRIPVFGWTLKRVHMLVDRGGSAESARAMIAEATQRISNGEILAIFPEGTRNKTEAPLLPFKKGAFILAKHTGAPIIPLAILNSGRLWPSGSFVPKPGLIKVAIGEPMAVKPNEPLSQISKRAYEILEGLYKGLEAQGPAAGGPSPEGAPSPAPPPKAEASPGSPPQEDAPSPMEQSSPKNEKCKPAEPQVRP